MALTTPRGFAGGPMSDIDYGIGAASAAWVETAGALTVTQPSSGTRTVSIATGTACAYGIRVTNDAAISQAITAPGSGSAWYLLALRFDWSAKTVTLQVLAGPTSGSTTAPTAIPATLPATMSSTPGTTFDLPLSWVWTSSATTTLTLFDLRLRRVLGRVAGTNLNALRILALQAAPEPGSEILALDSRTVFRWVSTSGGKWRPWHSEWAAYAGPANYTNGADGAAVVARKWDGGDLLTRMKIVFGSSSPALPTGPGTTALAFPIPSGVTVAENSYQPSGPARYQRAGIATIPCEAYYSGGQVCVTPVATFVPSGGGTYLRDAAGWPYASPAQSDTLFGEIRLEVSDVTDPSA